MFANYSKISFSRQDWVAEEICAVYVTTLYWKSQQNDIIHSAEMWPALFMDWFNNN